MREQEQPIKYNLKKVITKLDSIAKTNRNASQINMRGILDMLDKEILDKLCAYEASPLYRAIEDFKQVQEKEMNRGAEVNVRGALGLFNKMLDSYPY